MPHPSHDFLDEARRAIPEVSVEAWRHAACKVTRWFYSTCGKKTKYARAILKAPSPFRGVCPAYGGRKSPIVHQMIAHLHQTGAVRKGSSRHTDGFFRNAIKRLPGQGHTTVPYIKKRDRGAVERHRSGCCNAQAVDGVAAR